MKYYNNNIIMEKLSVSRKTREAISLIIFLMPGLNNEAFMYI